MATGHPSKRKRLARHAGGAVRSNGGLGCIDGARPAPTGTRPGPPETAGDGSPSAAAVRPNGGWAAAAADGKIRQEPPAGSPSGPKEQRVEPSMSALTNNLAEGARHNVAA